MNTPPACGVLASSASVKFSRSEVTYSVRPSTPPKHGIVGCVIGISTYSINAPDGLNRCLWRAYQPVQSVRRIHRICRDANHASDDAVFRGGRRTHDVRDLAA